MRAWVFRYSLKISSCLLRVALKVSLRPNQGLLKTYSLMLVAVFYVLGCAGLWSSERRCRHSSSCNGNVLGCSGVPMFYVQSREESSLLPSGLLSNDFFFSKAKSHERWSIMTLMLHVLIGSAPAILGSTVSVILLLMSAVKTICVLP